MPKQFTPKDAKQLLQTHSELLILLENNSNYSDKQREDAASVATNLAARNAFAHYISSQLSSGNAATSMISGRLIIRQTGLFLRILNVINHLINQPCMSQHLLLRKEVIQYRKLYSFVINIRRSWNGWKLPNCVLRRFTVKEE